MGLASGLRSRDTFREAIKSRALISVLDDWYHLPIIGYFAELQERQAMTQASEPEVVSEHSRRRGGFVGTGCKQSIARAIRSGTTASMAINEINLLRSLALDKHPGARLQDWKKNACSNRSPEPVQMMH